MARTKHTARKALDGAAMRMVQASKNIAVKAPRKPPDHVRCKREEGLDLEPFALREIQ